MSTSELNRNSQLAKINRLPAEVLSAVFVICQQIWGIDSKGSKSHTDKPYGCQLSLSTVCRSWRKVALDTTALWTHITLADRAPFQVSELILSRSGGVAPLNVDLCLTKSFRESKNPYDCEDEIASALDFIIEHDGSLSRWNRLRIEVDKLEAFYRLCSFFQESSFPALQSLELCYSGSLSPPGDHRGEISEAVTEAHIGFQEPPTQLRSLKLVGLVVPYFFGLSAPPDLSNLEHLELRFAGAPFETYAFNELPAASLLSSRDPDAEYTEEEALDQPRVLFSSLISFSILNACCAVWVLNQLLTLDAPNVTTFELTISDSIRYFDNGREATQHLVSYMATSGPVGAGTSPEPLFPSLSHLTYSNSSAAGSQEDLEVLLPTYPQLTSLAIPDCVTLAPLLKQPWLVPGLAKLRVGVKDVTELKELLVSRRNAGIPLQSVHIEQSALGTPIEAESLKELKELVDIVLIDIAEPKNNCNDERDGLG
ncbi:hypothetical protein FRC11_001026 [Ceratobasidium sp. 423]|nr:hypothetical protein FRC11_001026 [Ceratobasidium sp. 423]